jgi:hypothetical protein
MKRILLAIALIALGASGKADSDELRFRSDTAASIVPGSRNYLDEAWAGHLDRHKLSPPF